MLTNRPIFTRCVDQRKKKKKQPLTDTMDCSQILPRRPSTMEATVDTLAAMCHQEGTGYVTADFIRRGRAVLATALRVDDDCRTKMVTWSYQVVDFCKFSRESVEISLSYLDRFLLTPPGLAALQDRSVFQLAAMASLYTAVKIHEPEAMDPKLVSQLSRGTYSPEDVEEMERVILQALQWRVNPPTALSFVREFYNLIPAEAMSETARSISYDITKFQTELAVSESDFVWVKPSVTAYCSLMISLESLAIDPKIIQYVGIILQEAVGITDSRCRSILNVQSYLYTAVVRHPAVAGLTAAPATSPKPASRRMVTSSPRSSMVQDRL